MARPVITPSPDRWAARLLAGVAADDSKAFIQAEDIIRLRQLYNVCYVHFPLAIRLMANVRRVDRRRRTGKLRFVSCLRAVPRRIWDVETTFSFC